MENKDEKRSTGSEQKTEVGSLDSFNNRNEEKSTNSESAGKGKDEKESFMDYNGNSEANAPARSSE